MIPMQRADGQRHADLIADLERQRAVLIGRHARAMTKARLAAVEADQALAALIELDAKIDEARRLPAQKGTTR